MKLIRYEQPQWPSLNDFDRFFDFGFGRMPRPGDMLDRFFGETVAPAVPALDLYEDDDNYYVKAELPGVKKDEIELNLENSVLTLSATHKEEGQEGNREYSVSRSISVPEDVNAEKIGASSEDGVLTITLPKAEARKPRRISVK